MNKEPIALYIFRYILGFGLFAFMAMLYWSSLLLEEDNKTVRASLVEIKEQLSGLRSDLAHLEKGGIASPGSHASEKVKEQISSYPNLLEEDPFYRETLPKLLGPQFKPHGTFHSATFGRPDNLHPFSNWAEVSNWIALCTPTLARQEFGKYETLSSRSRCQNRRASFQNRRRSGILGPLARRRFLAAAAARIFLRRDCAVG